MIDFFAVFGNSRFESRYNDGDTFWVDGSGRLREGKMGIVRRCQWDSISKKGFKGFGWILEIMEIKTWAVRLRLCRLAQTNFVKIRSYQGMIFWILQRKGSKGEDWWVSRIRSLIQLYRNLGFQHHVLSGFFGLIWCITLRFLDYFQHSMIEDTIFGNQCVLRYFRFQKEKKMYKRGIEATFHIITFQQTIPFLLFSSWWSSLRFSLI